MRPLILGGDHSISFPVVRAVSEKLGGPVDILHLDAHPDIYHAFEGNIYSHASSFARIMEGGYARRLLQVSLFFNKLSHFSTFYVIMFSSRFNRCGLKKYDHHVILYVSGNADMQTAYSCETVNSLIYRIISSTAYCLGWTKINNK